MLTQFLSSLCVSFSPSRVLLDSLDTTTKKTAVAGVIASLFEGRSQAYIQCLHVDFKSSRDETFWDLSIQVKGCRTLTDSFAQYIEEELLDGDNKYRAEGHGLQAARKGTRFLSLPPVLQLQLKRFEVRLAHCIALCS
jgi:ubiquitin carboxyl-terminal hydrolase 7